MLSLLEMSFYGSVLVAAVLLVRFVAGSRLPKTGICLLWGVALIRLLLPLSAPSPVSVYAAASRLAPVAQRAGLLVTDTPVAEQGGAPASMQVTTVVWLAGLVFLAGYFLYFHLRSRQGYRASLPLEHPFVKNWLEGHRLRRPVQVRYSDQIGSPLTYGVLWPVLLLPKSLDWQDEEGLGYILAHELAHIRRFDAFTKWLLAAVLCVHWFNPLVWVMYLLASRDLELCCDEAVVRQYGHKARTPYALTLVKLEERRSTFAPLESGFSKGVLTERITAIMRSHPVTALSAGAAIGLVLGVTVMFATTAPSQDVGGTGAAAGNTVVKGNGYVTEAGGPSYGYDDYDMAPVYTQAQYDQVIRALYVEGYESMSIAEFNRRVNAALTSDDNEELRMAYEMVLSSLPNTDPMAAFLRNTVRASTNEYDARLSEVYNREKNDPAFWGEAWATVERTLLGQPAPLQAYAGYEFTYRILQQDELTVAERDGFLQAVMQAAQAALEAQAKAGGSEAEFRQALEEAGAKASTGKIKFIDCTINDVSLNNELYE